MSDEEIYKAEIDTVPPPDGEEDAYSAATRVGAGPPVEVLAALKEAASSGKPLKPQAIPKPNSLPVPAGASAAPAPIVPAAAKAPAPVVAVAASADAAPPADAAVPTGDPSLGRSMGALAIALAIVMVVFTLIGR